MIYDVFGKSISSNSEPIAGKNNSRLNGADVFWFGDSNVYYSAGSDLADINSWYQRLSVEFSINEWHNLGSPGQICAGTYETFNAWATDENVALFNKKSTFLLFWVGTNDSATETGFTSNAPWAVSQIADIVSKKFPQAVVAWFIPTPTDWSKWTGSSDADNRDMTAKVPLFRNLLESHNIPYCDMYATSGITTTDLSDGIHLGGGGANYNTDANYKAYRRIREYLMNK